MKILSIAPHSVSVDEVLIRCIILEGWLFGRVPKTTDNQKYQITNQKLADSTKDKCKKISGTYANEKIRCIKTRCNKKQTQTFKKNAVNECKHHHYKIINTVKYTVGAFQWSTVKFTVFTVLRCTVINLQPSCQC